MSKLLSSGLSRQNVGPVKELISNPDIACFMLKIKRKQGGIRRSAIQQGLLRYKLCLEVRDKNVAQVRDTQCLEVRTHKDILNGVQRKY